MKLRKWLKKVFIFTGLFIFSILFRVFFIEIYSIPSGSMEDTLLPGDKVLVNKLAYGPKLPASPYDIPWVNLVWFLQAGASANPDSVYWDYLRISGVSSIERSDVMIFSHPLWGGRNNFFIKRCVALPGDTLAIKSGRVKINGQYLPQPVLSKRVYDVWQGNSRQFSRLTDSLGLQVFGRSAREREKGAIELLLTETQKKQLWRLDYVDSLKIKIFPTDSILWVYPQTTEFAWTIDDYGPLVIPFQGMTIKLNHRNFLLYERTINRLEKLELEEKNNAYYVNGKQADQYIFRKNYYFMLGDNRQYSNDSRYWGFVPEENIVGKASLVLFNYRGGIIRWKRFFKPIK